MKLNLLTLGNPKTAKGLDKGYLNAILHLAPYNLSGVNVCPMAEIAGCVQGCLNTAGRGGILKGGGTVTVDSIKDGTRTNFVQQARIRRTRLFLENKVEFMSQLAADIRKVRDYATAHGLKTAIRLNGTSDIRWEDVPHWYLNIFETFPDVQFYDYTKIPNRRRALGIPNYHLTFSYSGAPVFQPYVKRALENYGNDANVAVVFQKGLKIPERFLDRPVVNGDETDLRFLDPKGVVVALTAKGNAKRDTTGFVVTN